MWYSSKVALNAVAKPRGAMVNLQIAIEEWSCPGETLASVGPGCYFGFRLSV
jgi:hypothetical protein